MQNKKIIWPLKVLLIASAPVWVLFLLFLLLLRLIAVSLCYLVLYLCIWISWLTRERNILFVYSDSPVWRDYMLFEMLEGRAVVLNWSELSAWKWWSLRVLAFRLLAGTKAFNPLLVLFRPFRLAKRFRFYAAFHEWKQGNRDAVDKLKLEITDTLASP